MVACDRLTDWDAHPRRSLDRRRSKTTSCAASRARMDGWWTVTAGCTVVVCLDPTAVLLDRRVEDWRGTRLSTFPAPASSNGADGFPVRRSPVCFASWVM